MPTRIYVPSINAALTLPDGMAPEAMQAAVAQLKQQHVASGAPRPATGPSNVELRAQLAQERATQAAEAPSLAMRVATSDPALGLLDALSLRPVAEGLGHVVAGAGNAVVATGKMALGQPLEEMRSVQVPILDAQGNDTGRTQFKNEWAPTYKWYGQGRETAYAPQNDPATQAKIGRDTEAPLEKPNESPAEKALRVARTAQRGVNQGLSDFGQSLTTPENLPFLLQGGVARALGAGPAAGAALGAEKALQASFIPGMVAGAVDANERAWDPNATLEQQVQAGLEALLSGGMGAHAFAGLSAKPTANAAPSGLLPGDIPGRIHMSDVAPTYRQALENLKEQDLAGRDVQAAEQASLVSELKKEGFKAKVPSDVGEAPSKFDLNAEYHPDSPGGQLRARLEQQVAARELRAQGVEKASVPGETLRPEQVTPRAEAVATPEVTRPPARLEDRTYAASIALARTPADLQTVVRNLIAQARDSSETAAIWEAARQWSAPVEDVLPPRPKTDAPRLYLNPIAPLARSAGRAVKGVAERAAPLYQMGAKIANYEIKPILSRLTGKGGPVTRELHSAFSRASSAMHSINGELGKSMDNALHLTGKLSAANRWADKHYRPTPVTAQAFGIGALEKRIPVPPAFRGTLGAADSANLAAGKLLESVTPGFKAGGKPQRQMTGPGVELYRTNAKAVEDIIQGEIAMNPALNPQLIRNKHETLREVLSEPTFDAAKVARIAQDMRQSIPHAVTHVRVKGQWVPVIESRLFNYLSNVRREASEITAFRREFPRDSDKFSKMMDAASKELIQAGQGDYVNDLHTLTRALQGQPIVADKSPTMRGAEAIAHATSMVTAPLKAAKLTLSAPINALDALAGGGLALVGVKPYMKALKTFFMDPKGQIALIRAKGYTDAVIRDWNFRWRSPAESTSRITSQMTNKLSGNTLMNEMAEQINGVCGNLIKDQIKAQDWTGLDRTRIGEVMRLMDFTDAEISKALGGDAALLERFATRFPGLATGGNLGRAERSYGSHNALLNSAFWYRSYTQNVLNRVRGSAVNFYDAASRFQTTRSKADAGRAYANAKILMGTLGVSGLQTFLAGGIIAGLTGLGYGLASWSEEANNFKTKTVVGAVASGVLGPIAQVARSNDPEGRLKITEKVTGMSPLFGSVQEFTDLVRRQGRYSGMSWPTAAGTFLENQVAASKAIRTALAVAGLAQKNIEYDAAAKSFGQWKRSKLGFMESGGGKPDTAPFRHQMQVVVKTWEKGGDWVAELAKVEGIKGDAANKTRADVTDWLSNQTILKNKTGSPLTPDETKDLIAHIGQRAYDVLKARDASVREIHATLGARDESGTLKPIESMSRPTGRAAVFQDAQAERNRRVMSGLSSASSNTLARLNYTPTWTPPVDMSPEVAAKAEKEYVKMLDDLLENVDASLPENVQRKLVTKFATTARKVAENTR